MKNLPTLVALIAILLAGAGSASAAKEVFNEKVFSLLDTLEEEKDESLRKKAVEELVEIDNRSIPLIIEALEHTKNRPVKEALVYILAHKKDERAKKVFFEVLKNQSFSSSAKEWAVYGLSQLKR